MRLALKVIAFILFIGIWLSLGEARAAPFIVSDSYPVTVAQPTSCRVAYDGSTAFAGWPVVMNADFSVYCKIDIAGLSPGAHVAQVKACVNVDTTTFTCNDLPNPTLNFIVLVAGAPAAPKNLRVVP